MRTSVTVLSLLLAGCGSSGASSTDERPSATDARPTETAETASALGSSAARSSEPTVAAAGLAACKGSRAAAATRAWVEAVERGSFDDLIARLPPKQRERARTETAALPEDKKAAWLADMQRAAARVRQALRNEPTFVDVPPIMAEPAQLEWYYCGEAPPGKAWQSPCVVQVREEEGHCFVHDVSNR